MVQFRFEMRRSLALKLGVACLGLGWTIMSTAAEGAETRVATAQISVSADDLLQQYFELQTSEIEAGGLNRDEVIQNWHADRDKYRQQLLYMLGLDPLPERTPLQPVVTGSVDRPDVRVENLHFQSRPGLYVSGNLYLPRDTSTPCPTILYVCGHAGVRKNDVSYGNKVHYHHHGVWFARNGYVCLVIDSLQLGEIEGMHHGTYRYGQWWWVNRGYTPAGVEAWNCIRALDYLATRPEVDSDRIGVTGRSGGGIYSWWLSALDDRIRAAVPVAGITDLRNQVVDGVIEGHCDCMFHINLFRWDFSMIPALVAPRPLLISNTDRDSIFPLDGVVRTHAQVRRLYRSLDAETSLALNISAGVHKDTQELRVNAFRWFDQHLRKSDELIRVPAEKLFEPEELQVFRAGLPEDAINAEIHETFVPVSETPEPLSDARQWEQQRREWLDIVRRQTFGGWPHEETAQPIEVEIQSKDDVSDCRIERAHFDSQRPYELPLVILRPVDVEPQRIELRVVDDTEWNNLQATLSFALGKDGSSQAKLEKSWKQYVQPVAATKTAVVFTTVRGMGPTRWTGNDRKQVQIRRRFHLLGQTLDGMRVWDVRRAIQASRQWIGAFPLELSARNDLAAIALYASLFEPPVNRLTLTDLPTNHRDGPILPNIRRHFDMQRAVAIAASRSDIRLHTNGEAQGNATDDWTYAKETLKRLQMPSDRFQEFGP